LGPSLGFFLDGRVEFRLNFRLDFRQGWGLCRAFFGLVGRGFEVVEVMVDGVADGVAPAFGAKGVDVFVLGEVDGLDQGLGEVSERGSGFGLDVAAGDGGEKASQGGAEIAGGNVSSGEEIRQVAAELIGGSSLGLFAGMVEAKMRMRAGAGSAATAAIGKRESTQGRAVL
jgi:hypothetical protein